MIRDCVSRQRSAFFFRLYDISGAALAQKKNESSSYERHVLKLKESESVSECLRSESCLRRKIQTEEKTNYISTYMADCGSHGGCRKLKKASLKKESLMDAESQISSVLNHIKAYSNVYKTFGLIEYLSEYLEMLECVYPSMRGIVHALSRSVSDHIHSQTFRHPDTTRITNKLFAEQCHDSPDSRLYPLMNATFWSRYHALKSKPERCCRQRV